MKEYQSQVEEFFLVQKVYQKSTVVLVLQLYQTPKGVMTDIDARKQKIGGEIICKVF